MKALYHSQNIIYSHKSFKLYKNILTPAVSQNFLSPFTAIIIDHFVDVILLLDKNDKKWKKNEYNHMCISTLAIICTSNEIIHIE